MEQRVIKYRALDLDGEWVFGQPIISNGTTLMFVGTEYELDQMGFKEGFTEVQPSTLGQFTGLKDIHLNDIYESDKIRYIQALFNTKEEKWPTKEKEVKWDKHRGAWNVFETKAGELNIEVIGNIYEPSEGVKTK